MKKYPILLNLLLLVTLVIMPLLGSCVPPAPTPTATPAPATPTPSAGG